MWPGDEDGNVGNTGNGAPTFSDPLREFESFTESAINPVLTPPTMPPPDSNNSGSSD